MEGRYINGKPEEVPLDTQRFTTQPHVRWYHTQFGRTIHQREARRGPAKYTEVPQKSHRGPAEVPQRFTRLKKQPRSNRTSAGTTYSLGGRIHHREAHRGPAEVPQRSHRGPQWSTTATQHVRAAQHAAWENDTSTGSPKRSRQIHGGPKVHEATGTLHNGPLRPSLPSSERIWTCGGYTRSGIAGVNSSKSQPERLHPGAKVKIIPQGKCHNLAGVFRYWLEAIRTVINSTLSPVHTGFLTYSLVLKFTLN